MFELIPGSNTGNQRGFSSLALILSAHSAEIRIVTYGPGSTRFHLDWLKGRVP